MNMKRWGDEGDAYRLVTISLWERPGADVLVLQRQRGSDEHEPARLAVVPERM